MIVLQIIVFLLGLSITLATLSSAIRQTVLPGRQERSPLTYPLPHDISPHSSGHGSHTVSSDT